MLYVGGFSTASCIIKWVNKMNLIFLTNMIKKIKEILEFILCIESNNLKQRNNVKDLATFHIRLFNKYYSFVECQNKNIQAGIVHKHFKNCVRNLTNLKTTANILVLIVTVLDLA